MIMKKKVVLFVQAALAVMLILTGCGSSGVSEGGPAYSLQVYPALVELPVGEAIRLQVSTQSGNANSSEVEWSSSDSQIAQISADGRVEAKAEGRAVIEAQLAGDKGKKGACHVVVVPEGPILLFDTTDIDDMPGGQSGGENDGEGTMIPGLPGGGGSGQEVPPPDDNPGGEGEGKPEAEGGDGENIPVEHDPEIDIPVEHDPTIDEFIWTIRINDTITEELEDPDMPMKVKYKLKLNAVKKGGKTSKGLYKGTASLEFKVDASEATQEVIDKAEGALVNFSVNVGGSYTADSLSMEVVPYNHMELTDFGSGPAGGSEGPKIVPLVPQQGPKIVPLVPQQGPEIVPLKPRPERPEIVSLVPKYGMAYGYELFEGTGAYDISVSDARGLSLGEANQIGIPMAMTYKLSIGSAGKVELQLMELKTGRAFKGWLSKKPTYSK